MTTAASKRSASPMSGAAAVTYPGAHHEPVLLSGKELLALRVRHRVGDWLVECETVPGGNPGLGCSIGSPGIDWQPLPGNRSGSNAAPGQ